MAKPVAVDGDVSATPSVTPYRGAQGGTWTAAPISYQKYEKLVSGGKAVVWQAKCTFSFSGTNSSGATVTGTEDVTLAAGATKLQGSENGVLLDGDSQSGSTYGNELSVSAAGKLRG